MQKARTCGGIPLAASHWFRPISRIPLIAFHRLRSSGSFQRLTPKAHPERRISSFQGLHFMKRTSSCIVTSCPSMEIIKPGHRHPRNPPFAPQSSKHMLITGGSITFVFFLAGSTAISLQGQGTIPYCRTNSCALRAIQFIPPAGFSIGN